jgi:GTP-binding protein HflX
VHLSAVTGEGLDLLQLAIKERLDRPIYRGGLILTPAQGKARALLYRLNAIQAESIDERGMMHLQIEVMVSELKRICRDCQIPLPAVLMDPTPKPEAWEAAV